MSGNLFETRKDWLISPNYTNDSNISTYNTTGLKPPIKVEPKPEGQPTTSPKAQKCGWGPNCPFCKNQEDWNGDHQKQLQQQRSNSKTFDVSDQYPSQLRLLKQWEEEMERLNSKYNLDCFSDSELDSESDKREEYKYEHGCETLI